MQLHVIERGPDSAAMAQPPVVFLHGLFGRGRNFGFFQRRIAETRRTLALDLRNHGDSPHGPMDYPTMAADVLETLERHAALPAVLVGHSMGGKTAMMCALTRPEAVTRLLVADIAPGEGGFSQNAHLAAELAALHLPAYLDRAGADALLARVIPEANVRGLMMQNLELGDNPRWIIGLSEIAAAMPAIVGWPHIAEGVHYDGPVLFVAGQRSNYIQPANYPEMKRLFPHYTLKTIENAGHWVHADQPQAFYDTLTAFI